jgi:phage tail protein X
MPRARRRPLWPAAAAVVVAGVIAAGVWQSDQVVTRSATLWQGLQSGARTVTTVALVVWEGVRERLAPTARPVSAAPEPPVVTDRPDPGPEPSATPREPEPRPQSPAPDPASTPRPDERGAAVPPPLTPVVETPRHAPSEVRPASAARAPKNLREVAPPMPAAMARVPAPEPEPRATALVPGKRPASVAQGETVSNLAYQAYGRYNTLAIDLIKEANPHIQDLDWIRSGEQIYLPPLNAETLIRSQEDGSYRIVLASFLSQAAAEKLSDLLRRRGHQPTITPRQVTRQLALYRVEISGLISRTAAEQAWNAAVANCWVFIDDTPCEGKSHE